MYLFIYVFICIFHLFFFVVADDVNSPCLSPASFLRCLRANKIQLTVEEEAILLDCLDIERTAELGSRKFHINNRKNNFNSSLINNEEIIKLNKNKSNRNFESLYKNKDEYEDEKENENEFNHSTPLYSSLNNGNVPTKNFPAKNILLESENIAPLIYYKSFLNFCTRHCGSWSGK